MTGEGKIDRSMKNQMSGRCQNLYLILLKKIMLLIVEILIEAGQNGRVSLALGLIVLCCNLPIYIFIRF